jgi:hypothetical protein
VLAHAPLVVRGQLAVEELVEVFQRFLAVHVTPFLTYPISTA